MTLGVIFDMDGVLIDSETFYFKRRMKFCQEKGILPGSEDKLDYIGKTENGIWQTMIPDDMSRKKLREEYVEYRKKYPIDFTKALRSEVKPLLVYLKNKEFKIALASSSPKSEIHKMSAQNKLDEFFDFIISGEELMTSKPHPEIYLIAERELGCDKSIAIEDSPVGIVSAKTAGLYTVALKQGFPLDQTKANIIIDDLLDVIKVVEHCIVY